MKHNRWTLLEFVSDYCRPGSKCVVDQKWLARCDCGTEKVVFRKNVITGKSKSCGCLRFEVSALLNLQHGASARGPNFKTYGIWCGMKRRCYNQNEKFYAHYGGRGIVVCDRWLHSFESFLADMGVCPAGHSIERLDVNGNYEPSNCVWIERRWQAQNTRRSKLNKDQAAEIIRLQSDGVPTKEIAARFSVDRTMVNKICRGENWANARESV